MVAPTFPRSTNATTDPTGARHGGANLNYAFSVLDGTHATDRIMITAIEDVARAASMMTPNWIIRHNPTNIAELQIIRVSDGAIENTATSILQAFRRIEISTLSKDGDVIVVQPSDNWYEINVPPAVGTAQLTKSFTIWGYGAKIRAGNVTGNDLIEGGAIHQGGEGKSLSVFGLTFDSRNAAGARRIGKFITCGSLESNINPSLILIKDCVFQRPWQYALYLAGGEVYAQQDNVAGTNIIVDNCYFDAGTEAMQDDIFWTSTPHNLWVSRCTQLANKPMYCNARRIWVRDCFSSTDYMETDPHGAGIEGKGWGMQAVYLDIRRCTIVGGNMTLSPLASVHSHNIYDHLRNGVVEDCTFRRGDRLTSHDAIMIRGYDDFGLENLTLSNIHIQRGKITTELPTVGIVGEDANPQTKSVIKNLTIKNVYWDEFQGDYKLFESQDFDINCLRIENVRVGTAGVGPTFAAGRAPVSFRAERANNTIGFLSIKNLQPTTDGNIVEVSAPSTTSTPSNSVQIGPHTVTLTAVESPLEKGQKGLSITGGATGSTMKFITNWGRATFSGTGSATTFNIPHGLMASPNLGQIQITRGSAGANGRFHVTADATNITVTYATAPASGTNNVVLYWEAAAAT
jgi:hypothetical protein